MIIQLVSDGHRYTHRVLERVKPFKWRSAGYSWAFRQRRLPWATYIFSDMDRLGFWELELAGRLHKLLREAGMRTVNDPARVLQRFSMLRHLKRTGFNQFDVWSVEDDPEPPRFPVFLRTQSAHRGPLGDLLHDQAQVDAAIADALGQGIPRKELMLVEYCAEPVRPGLFRKLSMFRVGERMVATVCAHESRWAAKRGELGIAGAELYDDEFDLIRNNRHADPLRPAFDLAGIEYGRADFGLVGGRPQIYEINTNPHITRIIKHPFAIRLESDRVFFDNLCAALAAIDATGRGRSVAINSVALRRHRRRDRRLWRGRWVC